MENILYPLILLGLSPACSDGIERLGDGDGVVLDLCQADDLLLRFLVGLDRLSESGRNGVRLGGGGGIR